MSGFLYCCGKIWDPILFFKGVSLFHMYMLKLFAGLWLNVHIICLNPFGLVTRSAPCLWNCALLLSFTYMNTIFINLYMNIFYSISPHVCCVTADSYCRANHCLCSSLFHCCEFIVWYIVIYKIKRGCGKHTGVNEFGVTENVMAGNLLLVSCTS